MADGTGISLAPKHLLSLHLLLDLDLRTSRGQGTTRVEAAMLGRTSTEEVEAVMLGRTRTGQERRTTTTSYLSRWWPRRTASCEWTAEKLDLQALDGLSIPSKELLCT